MSVVQITDAPKASKQEKLELYCAGIANGLSKEQAYIDAGYAPAMARANAQKYHRQNHEFIQGYIAEHIGSHAPTALKVLLKIMNDEGEKGGIRLKAAQDVLDRSGFSVKQKLEITTKEVKDLSTEELQNEIRKLTEDNPDLLKIFGAKAE